MLTYDSVEALILAANESKNKISELVIRDQAEQMDTSEEEIFSKMLDSLIVMQNAANQGIKATGKSASGISGGDANLMHLTNEKKDTISGNTVGSIIEKALALGEWNACMGKIVAMPTAGSCGVFPSVMLTLQEEKGFADEQIVASMFTAAAIGMIISEKATLAGALGGCQAECGSAAAMTAGALVELSGGTPEMVGHAAAIAIKALLGLVCDPVAGLVEVPCIKRNVSSAMVALSSAEMALAGIKSFIPVDEVLSAMDTVGRSIPASLRETGEGGLAATETAKNVKLGE